jgi:tetratricopeptide (TPR) repeat protein
MEEIREIPAPLAAPHRPRVRALLLSSLVALGLVAGCGSDASPEANEPASPALSRPEGVALCYSDLAESHPATKAFRAALDAGDREARAAAIEGLEAAVEEHPDEEELALFLGLASLWRVAEPLEADQGATVSSALKARAELERAYELCPTDHRIAAWLGPVLVNMGRALGQDALVDQGIAVLDEGIARYPSFVLFSKLLAYADRPADDPEFQNALDAIEANLDACVGDDGELARDPACLNGATARHNVQGASVFLGDVFAKAGRTEEARATYEQARASEGFATWDFGPLLDDRLATLDARVASFANADPADDAESAWVAGYQCAVCHTR